MSYAKMNKSQLINLIVELLPYKDQLSELIREHDVVSGQLTGANERIRFLESEVENFKTAGISLAKELEAYKAAESDDRTDETTDLESGMPGGEPVIDHKAELLKRLSTRLQNQGLVNPKWEHIQVNTGSQEDWFRLTFNEQFYKANKDDCYKFFGSLLEWVRKNAKVLCADCGTCAGGVWIRIRPL